MKCVIPAINVKVFGRAIHCLARIGDELYIEPLEEGLALRTVNTSRSAYACFIFSPNFFGEYDDGSGSRPTESDDEDDVFRCRITMKSCLAVFKSLSSIEKSVERCQIQLSLHEARMVFQLYCKHGIVKTYNLTYQETETLQAVFSKDLSPNKIVASSRIWSDTVMNFQMSLEEISINVNTQSISFKNYVEDEPDPTKVMHTEMRLNPEEFQHYCIGIDTEVTFCLKELRAILSFSDATSLPLSVHFETTGKPIVFCIESESLVEACFVLATLADPSSSQSQSSQHASHLQSSSRISTAAKSTRTSKIKDQASFRKKKSDATNSTVDNLRNSIANVQDAGFPDDDTLHLTTHNANGQDEDTLLTTHNANGQDQQTSFEGLNSSPVIPMLLATHQETHLSEKKDNSEKNNDVGSSDDEAVPGTPPSKKFKSLFFGSSQDSQSTNMERSRPPVAILAEDTDEEDSD